jgi:hypothetical protein
MEQRRSLVRQERGLAERTANAAHTSTGRDVAEKAMSLTALALSPLLAP